MRSFRASKEKMEDIIEAVIKRRPTTPAITKENLANQQWVIHYHKQGWTNRMIALGMGRSRSWVCNMLREARERGDI